jgi:hypothetical protein
MFFLLTDTILEPFIPPEGDGRLSTLTKEGAKQRYEALEKKGKTMLHLRRLRRFEEDFDSGDFSLKAQDIYIDAHNTLVRSVEIFDQKFFFFKTFFLQRRLRKASRFCDRKRLSCTLHFYFP